MEPEEKRFLIVTQDSSKPPSVSGLEGLNQALRELIQEVRVSEAPVGAIEEALAGVQTARSALAAYTTSGPFAQASLEGAGPHSFVAGNLTELFPFSPIIGPLNPVSPPVRFEVQDGVVTGRANWGPAYCGPPNHVHGGVIACAFDELLGAVNVVNDVGAMTGTLTIRYRRPTPLLEEIRMEGRHTGTERRKVFAEGKMWHGDTLLAEAEGIFVSIEGNFRDELMARGVGHGAP